jgi:hypothetical protein
MSEIANYSCGGCRLTTKLNAARWQRACTEAERVVKPVTHKLNCMASVRSGESLCEKSLVM